MESYRSKDIEIRLGEEGGEGEREGGSKGRRGKEERKDGGRNTHTLTPSQA